MQASRDQPQHLVVWDEMLADVGSHHGLLQAYSVHCAPPVFDGKTNTVFASSLEQKEAEISAVGRTCTNLDMERVNAVSNCMLSMADTNAHGIFDEMPVLGVVWDEELQHMCDDQHDLLKELAQGGECHVVENKLMVMGSMDEPTHNTGAPMLLELGMASVDVIYDEMPQLDVVWDVGPLHNIDSHDALVQHEAQFDECSVVDNDITGDLVISDLLTHDNDTFLTEFDMGSANKLSNHLPLGVIWDEEFEHGQSSHGLLRHIALSADYLVGEEKPNAEPHTYDVLTHVSVSPCLLELGIEAMHQSAEIHREDNHATVPECVEFTDHITSSGDAQEAFASIHNDREATSLTDEGAFYSCKVSECAAVKVFNKTTLPDVVWDHEPQHGPKSHGLLLQLASGEECLVGMDNKLIAELVIFKLAGSRESIDGEKAKGVIMADIDKVLTHIGGLSHFLEICETSNADEEGKLVAEILIHESGLLQYPEISVTEFSPQYLNAQVIDDQMHNKHIDFNTSVLFYYDALNMISKISWADILRAIVEFDVNEKLAMDRECLNGENMIFDAGIDALCSSDLVCLSSQFRNHINCHHNEKMLLSENYILYHPVGPRKYYGVHTSVFLSFASSCRTYSSSLRSQCSGLRLEDMAIGLLRRGVFVYCLEKYRFDAAYLLLGNLSSFSDLSQCSNDTGYVLDKVPAWCNNGFSPRANAQLGVPKIRYFHGWYFGQVKGEASEFVGQCPLFSSGQKHVKQKSIWNMSWSYGRVQNCSLSDIFMTERPEGSSAGALHNTQRLSHVDYGIVDRDFKYIGISALSNSATCPIRQWDPGGNPDCFIPAIAWGQAMFCGGGNVIPGTIGYMA